MSSRLVSSEKCWKLTLGTTCSTGPTSKILQNHCDVSSYSSRNKKYHMYDRVSCCKAYMFGEYGDCYPSQIARDRIDMLIMHPTHVRTQRVLLLLTTKKLLFWNVHAWPMGILRSEFHSRCVSWNFGHWKFICHWVWSRYMASKWPS